MQSADLCRWSGESGKHDLVRGKCTLLQTGRYNTTRIFAEIRTFQGTKALDPCSSCQPKGAFLRAPHRYNLSCGDGNSNSPSLQSQNLLQFPLDLKAFQIKGQMPTDQTSIACV